MPLVNVIDPVGAGLLPPPLALIATVSACAAVMLLGEGVTVTVGMSKEAVP